MMLSYVLNAVNRKARDEAGDRSEDEKAKVSVIYLVKQNTKPIRARNDQNGS